MISRKLCQDGHDLRTEHLDTGFLKSLQQASIFSTFQANENIRGGFPLLVNLKSRVFKMVFLKLFQSSSRCKNTCARASFLIKLQTPGNFVKKEALAQIFSYEFCEIFVNIFFIEHIPMLLFEYVFIWIIFCEVLIIF